MRLLLFLCAFLFSFNVFAQDYASEWNIVIQNELDGKTESANKKVLEIYGQAKKDKNEPQVIKCFFYISKFRQVFDEKAHENTITQLREEIATASPTSKAVLNYIYGEILLDFLNYHFHKINKITPVQGNLAPNITTWSVNDFKSEIIKSFEKSLTDIDLLNRTPINNFKDILEIPAYVDGKNHSLYELLHNQIAQNYLSLFKNYNFRNELPITAEHIERLYGNTNEFTTVKDETYTIVFQSFLNILQQKELFIKKTNPDQLDNTVYKRLLTIDQLFQMSKNLDSALTQIEKNTTNKILYYELRLRKVKHIIQFGTTEINPNNLKEALQELEEIIKANPNEYIVTDALIEKEKILDKYLHIRLDKVNYEGENTRAFANFKNINSLKISYYKISTKEYLKLYRYSSSKNDEFSNLINTKKPFKESLKELPNPKTFYQYSTEILMDKLPLGYYVIVFEDTDKDANTQIAKNYSLYQVTNISLIKNENDNNVSYHTYHRKTGKPLTSAYLHNKERTVKADEIGKIIYPKPIRSEKTNYSDTYLIVEKDTLVTDYYVGFKTEGSDEEELEAKAMLYLDRAIYRPGQKVFFKGIFFQNKNDKKSVVPHLTVHLTIEDASNETIKEFDIQTNEFGSFSGEFDLPKNCLTGDFTIEIEEPDDKIFKQDKKYYNAKEGKHAFWENADFYFDTFYFQVEEYKRPTFEIKTDKIKEVYGIGDTVSIKGHAKTLAGSNLTNTMVKYRLSRNYYPEKGDYSNDANYIQTTATTDSNGEFSIPISFTIDGLKNEEIKSLTITLNLEITDINGETIAIGSTYTAEKETLKVKTKIPETIFEENNNTITVEITNQNDSPINYQGKIEIYKEEKKSYLKNRTFGCPDIQSITEEDFKKLFPFEPYCRDEEKSTLINTIYFDTEKGIETALPKLEKGNYKIITSVIDSKSNAIFKNNYFEVNSNLNPSLNNKVFTFKRINREDESEIHFEFITSQKELHITTLFYCGENSLEEKITTIENGRGTVSFKKLKNPKYDYAFFFFTQWENDGYSENVTFQKEALTRKIDFEVISFRNKIEPGSKENWSFKINDNKLETEVLASMYDSSLDFFTKRSWRKPYFFHHISSDFPTVNNRDIGEIYFSDKKQKIYYQKITFTPRFQWYGFSFTDSKSNYIKKEYEQKVAVNQIIREGTKLIQGTVSDASGPIPGANIVIKGTLIGVQTDFDGSYSIRAKEGEVLEFSFMGMRDVAKTVGLSNTINTTLQDDTTLLKEVVMTSASTIIRDDSYRSKIIVVTSNDKDLSYFREYLRRLYLSVNEDDNIGIVRKKSSVTSSYSTIESYELVSSSSIDKNEKAMIIIDGETKDLAALKKIPQEDITSISILTEKEATNLYGAKGANGVIIITTKNALKELNKVKTRTNFNETAFFYPHLTTDRKGRIAFSFTTPESLTKWKLRLLGHDKNGDVGNFETEIISQKDIMVMPNMPRFLRETDTISIVAKVVNLTKETKSGNIVLQLYDAATGNSIDTVCLNDGNIKTFNCKAKENTVATWKIYIPEGIQGIQYKVIAKSGNFSDGEENLLPVLSNKILVTETMPIWIRENTKKDFVLENLKNNNSKTLKNQSFTFEFTSNPTWLAVQSLPYLMEFEHECAEQTFARFYANTIAAKIIDSQPKIAEVFEKWRQEPNKKTKIEMNEELKSIVLRETPWFFEVDEIEKNRRIATLFELQKLKDSNESALRKLKEKQNETGGFAWFKGGPENYYVTQHILSGIGHLNKMSPMTDLVGITQKAIPFIDAHFVYNTQKQRKEKRAITSTEVQYLYCRSFYIETNPIKNDTLKKAIQYQIQQTKSNWLKLNLGEKAMLALTAKRFGDSLYAQKITTHLKESAVKDAEKGMYWIANKSGYYWFDAPIENQALLIEAFAEIDNNPTIINDLKAWLIHRKQRENWGTTKATTEAVYALLNYGNNPINQKTENTFSIGNKQLLEQKLNASAAETATGYFKLQWKSDEVTKELATIAIENKSNVPNFGGAYWQYFESLENIKTANNASLSINKEVYKKINDKDGEKLLPLKETTVKVGDIITIRLVINAESDLEFVHLKDSRASCLEPISVLSTYKNNGGLWYYMSTKDTATHFFFDNIKKGTYVLEYDVRVNNQGSFNNGIATLQSMYAPEFSTHSTSTKIKIAE